MLAIVKLPWFAALPPTVQLKLPLMLPWRPIGEYVPLKLQIDWTPALRAEALEVIKRYKIGPLFTPPVVSRWEGPRGTLMLPTTDWNSPEGFADEAQNPANDAATALAEKVAGSTDARSSACDVLVQRAGVCRDFAHVALTLCRALSIPARYVSGYAVGLNPPDFHGFFEAYLGTRWYLFDATRMAPRDGLVRIGTGRDAADAAFATVIGAATLKDMTVSAQELTDEIAAQPTGDGPAITTA